MSIGWHGFSEDPPVKELNIEYLKQIEFYIKGLLRQLESTQFFTEEELLEKVYLILYRGRELSKFTQYKECCEEILERLSRFSKKSNLAKKIYERAMQKIQILDILTNAPEL